MKKLLNELKDVSNALDDEVSKERELVNILCGSKALIKILIKKYKNKIKFYNIENEYGYRPMMSKKEWNYYRDKDGDMVKGIFILRDIIEQDEYNYLAIVYYLTEKGTILQFKETNAYNNWSEFKERILLNEDYILGDLLELKEYCDISFATVEDVISAIKNNLENRIKKINSRNVSLNKTLEDLKKIESMIKN